jgi:uncharacterized protein YqgC (DUF456 family)
MHVCSCVCVYRMTLTNSLLCVCVCVFVCVCLFVCLPACLPVYLSLCVSVCLGVYSYACLAMGDMYFFLFMYFFCSGTTAANRLGHLYFVRKSGEARVGFMSQMRHRH